MRLSKLLPFLFFLACVVSADNVAVKYYGTNNLGYPTNWFAEIQEIGNGTNLPPGYHAVIDRAVYNSNRAVLFVSVPATNLIAFQFETNRIFLGNQLSIAFDRLRDADRDWNTLSNAQRIDAVRDTMRAVLMLRKELERLRND